MRSLLDSFWDNSKKKKNSGKSFGRRHVSYWFDEEQYGRRFAPYGGHLDEGQTGIVNSLKMAGFRRSCANFVHILTGDPTIKVMYNSNDDSFTDGRTVVISGDINAEKFDSTVGLALHEASHIKYTNFDLIEEILVEKDVWDKYITLNHWRYANNIPGFAHWFAVPYDRSKMEIKPWFTDRGHETLFGVFKILLNWIEDRRIDNLSYAAAPGYRPYYTSMYERYWDSDEVNEMIASDGYRTESVDSYMQRIINLLSPNNDSHALKSLKKIEDMIDVKNILRLKSTHDAAQVASDVLLTILSSVEKWSENEEKNKKFESGDDGQKDGQKEFGQSPTLSIFPDNANDLEHLKRYLKNMSLEDLLAAMSKQGDLINGTVVKVKIDKTMAQNMDVLKSAGVTMTEAGGDEFGKVSVLTINRIDDAVVDSSEFSHFFEREESYYCNHTLDVINRGFALGTTLGKRLQVRNEERSLKYTRQKGGRVERRLVSGLGYDNDSIFSRIEIDKYLKCHVHISIDISGSMQGDRFDKSIETSTAIAKACTMVKNLECVISLRGTTQNGVPVLAVMYDSRKDGLAHIRKYGKRIKPDGSTPESLCFEALVKILPVASRDKQVLFVNISDGEPGWRGRGSAGDDVVYYHGDNAIKHCRKIMKRIKDFHGAAILGYFISDEAESFETFVSMYGRENSVQIANESNIFTIATSMNRKFLEANRMIKVNN